MNEERLKEEVFNGDRAAFFLESEVFLQAVEEVKAEILKAFNDPRGTTQTRDEAFRLQMNLGMLCAKLQGRVNDGKIAQSLLERWAARLKQRPFLRKAV